MCDLSRRAFTYGRVAVIMSEKSSTPSDVLATIQVEAPTEVQQEFVTAIRGLQTGSRDNQPEGEDLRLQVVAMYTPEMLFCHEHTRNLLLHYGMLTWLEAHGVSFRGTASM